MNIAWRSRLLVVILVLTGTRAQTAEAPANSKAQQKVFQRLLNSTTVYLRIKTATTTSRSYKIATGALVDAKRRLVITNYHVVGDEADAIFYFPIRDKGQLITDRKAYFNLLERKIGIKGKVVSRNAQKDLALVQLDSLPSEAKEVPLARTQVKPGQSVFAIGNPGDNPQLWNFKPQKVKSVDHKIVRSPSVLLDAMVIMTDVEGRKGESGGPLVNERCELVGLKQGMLVAKPEEGLFVDLTEIKAFLAGPEVVRVPVPKPEFSKIDLAKLQPTTTKPRKPKK